MNIRRILILLVIVVMGIGFIQVESSFTQDCKPCVEDFEKYALDGCTVVLVGKKASADGSIISTHTCDCGVCDWSWRYVPPADHEPGSKRKIYWFPQFVSTPPSDGYHWDNIDHKFNGLEIDQVPHTFGYMHGMFGYINDNQVAIGESTIGCP